MVAQSITQIHDLKTRRALEDASANGVISPNSQHAKALVANSLVSLSMIEYTEFMRLFMQRAVSAASTNSMRAAVAIAEKMGQVDIIHEARRQSKVLKFRQLVTKDKWMIAAQVCMLSSSSQLYIYTCND